MNVVNFSCVSSYIDSMELIFLFFLYYLAQNPNFTENMKPILGTLKNSEEMLKFMNNLSKFSELFSSAKPSNSSHEPPKNSTTPPSDEKPHAQKDEKHEPPQSPTKGIADDFIEKCLADYFKNR